MKTLIRLVPNRSLNQRWLLQSVRLAWIGAAMLTGCPASNGSSTEQAGGDLGDDDPYEYAAYCEDEVVSRFNCSDAPKPDTVFRFSQLGINVSTVPIIAVDDEFLYVSLADLEDPEAGGTFRLAKDGSNFTKLSGDRFDQLLVVGDRLFAYSNSGLWSAAAAGLWSMRKDGTELKEHKLLKSTEWHSEEYEVSAGNLILGEDGRIFIGGNVFCARDKPTQILAFDPATETTTEIATDTCIRTFAVDAGYVYWAQSDYAAHAERLRRAPIGGGPATTLATAPGEWRWSGLAIAGAKLYAMVSDGVGSDETVEMELDGTELTCFAPAGVGSVDQTREGVIARLSAIHSPDCVLQIGNGRITVVGNASTSGFGLYSKLAINSEFVYSAGADDIERLPFPAQDPDSDLPMTLPR